MESLKLCWSNQELCWREGEPIAHTDVEMYVLLNSCASLLNSTIQARHERGGKVEFKPKSLITHLPLRHRSMLCTGNDYFLPFNPDGEIVVYCLEGVKCGELKYPPRESPIKGVQIKKGLVVVKTLESKMSAGKLLKRIQSMYSLNSMANVIWIRHIFVLVATPGNVAVYYGKREHGFHKPTETHQKETAPATTDSGNSKMCFIQNYHNPTNNLQMAMSDNNQLSPQENEDDGISLYFVN